MKKIKLLSLFSGIGAFEKALDNIGVRYELVNYCEIDRYASKAYAMIHECSEEKNLGDITKVETDKLPNDIDILTYGFPCQDISLAGRQRGFDENGKRTRSGLFFEALRIIEDKKPRVAICENVKNLTSKKFSKEFDTVLNSLVAAGYRNYWKVLNAKDYGVPQNRERVFIVSIRQDIDTGDFDFPQGFPLKKRLKDILENKVDECFYLSQQRFKKLLEHKKRNKEKGNGFGARFVTGEDIASTLTTSPEKSSGQYLKVVTEIGETVRKFTPLESWRLMGFSDMDIKKVTGISNTQLYKMAGNSIVVDVLENIFKEIFKVTDFENNKAIQRRECVVFKLENNYQMAFSF